MSTEVKIHRTPIHEQVVAALRDELAQLRPGDKLTSEIKLARRFGISVNTVREAITTFAHEGLVKRQVGRGTYVLDRASHKHVALVLGVHQDHTRMSYYFFRLLEYLHLFFVRAGFVPRLYWARSTPETPDQDGLLAEFTRALSRGEVAGIVVIKGPLDNRWEDAVNRSGVPVVGGASPYTAVIDYAQLVRESVHFLAEQGRRRIALLTWIAPELGAADYRAVFRETVRRSGADTREEWIRYDLSPIDSGAGYSLFRELWMAHREKPDGLLIGDEVYFPDFAAAVAEIGVPVPEKLLVVTHANKGSGTIYPFPVARLEYDPDETGGLLGDRLLRLMRREAVPEGAINISFNWVGREASDAGQGSLRSTIQERQVENQNPVARNQ